jgi:hypothetical protein
VTTAPGRPEAAASPVGSVAAVLIQPPQRLRSPWRGGPLGECRKVPNEGPKCVPGQIFLRAISTQAVVTQQYAEGVASIVVRVPCACGCEVEIPEAAIMSEAGRIAVNRRRSHRGATPKIYTCRWCGTAIQGRAALEGHEPACGHRPSGDLVEVSELDLIALAWTPDALSNTEARLPSVILEPAGNTKK